MRSDNAARGRAAQNRGGWLGNCWGGCASRLDVHTLERVVPYEYARVNFCTDAAGTPTFDCCVLSSRGRVLFPELFTEESVDPLQLVSALVGIGKNAVMLSRLIVADFDGLACCP